MKQPLILRNIQYKQFQGKALWAWLFLLSGYVLFLIGMYWWDDEQGLYRFIMPTTFFVLAVFHYFSIKKQRIVVSDFGIKYVSGYLFFTQNYFPGWEVSWDEIHHAFLNKNKSDLNNPQTPLHILLKNKRVLRLTPSQWFDPLESKSIMNAGNLLNLIFRRKNLYLSVVDNNPLVNIFAERGLLKDELYENFSGWTDITADSLVISLVFVFSILLSYYFYEMFSGLSETYADTPPYFWMLVAGVMIALWGYWFIRNTKLKHFEKIIVGVLLGLGVSLASYPFLMRINQWTDAVGIQTYQYKLAEKGLWVPQNQSLELPNISFGYKAEIYWRQFKINSVKEFQIRRGGLRIYQLNMEPIRKDWEGFYEGKQGYYAREHKE